MTDSAIICSKKKCSHRMHESELVTVKSDGIARTQGCPKCGCESYYMMTKGQIKWWENKKKVDCKSKLERLREILRTATDLHVIEEVSAIINKIEYQLRIES